MFVNWHTRDSIESILVILFLFYTIWCTMRDTHRGNQLVRQLGIICARSLQLYPAEACEHSLPLRPTITFINPPLALALRRMEKPTPAQRHTLEPLDFLSYMALHVLYTPLVKPAPVCALISHGLFFVLGEYAVRHYVCRLILMKVVLDIVFFLL